MKDLAILVLNYKTYEMTLKLLEQLNTIMDKDTVRIVVDNASPNDSVEQLKLKQQDLNFVLLESKENGGYAKGNNIGLRYAYENQIKYVLLINNDIIIKTKTDLDFMLELIESNPKIGVVSPILENIDKTISHPQYPIKPSFWDLSFGYFAYCKKRSGFSDGQNRVIYSPRGSCMLLKMDYINKINYLDENTFLYYEEPILAERLLNIGIECWLCGKVKVIHNHGSTISSVLNKNRTLQYLVSSYKYYLKEYRKWGFFKLSICEFIKRLPFRR